MTGGVVLHAAGQEPPPRPQIKVRLSTGVYNRLKRLARRDGRTITWHIATAVAAYLKENGA